MWQRWQIRLGKLCPVGNKLRLVSLIKTCSLSGGRQRPTTRKAVEYRLRWSILSAVKIYIDSIRYIQGSPVASLWNTVRNEFTLDFFVNYYYKVSYTKYRNIHKQRTAQTTWRVQKARPAQLGAANRMMQLNCQSLISAVIPFVKMLECSRRSSNSRTKSSNCRWASVMLFKKCCRKYVLLISYSVPWTKSVSDQSNHLQHTRALRPMTELYLAAIPWRIMNLTKDDGENKQDRTKRAERLQISAKWAKCQTIMAIDSNELREADT